MIIDGKLLINTREVTHAIIIENAGYFWVRIYTTGMANVDSEKNSNRLVCEKLLKAIHEELPC